MQSGSAREQDVKLEVTTYIRGDSLYITYRLHNRGSKDLIAFDGNPGDPKDPWPDLSSAVGVTFEQPDKLLIKRVYPRTPPNVDRVTVQVPAVSVTAPGQSREVHFRLTIPVREQNRAFEHSPQPQYAEQVARRVEVWIGYFWKTDKTILKPFPEYPKAFRARGEFGCEQIVRSSVDQQVKAEVRTDSGFVRQ